MGNAIGYQWHLPFGSLDQNTPQHNSSPLLGLTQLPSFQDQSIIGELESSSLRHSQSSLPLTSVPGLASSFQTEIGSLASEIPGSDVFAEYNHENSSMVDESVNNFQMDTVGLSAINDPDPFGGSRKKGKEVSREADSGFNIDTYFDTDSFQERLKTSVVAIAPNVSDGLLYEGSDSSIGFPALESHYNYYADAYGPSPVDGPQSGLY